MAHPTLLSPVAWHSLIPSSGMLLCLIDGAGMQNRAASLSALVTLVALAWQYVTQSPAGRGAGAQVNVKVDPAHEDLLTGLPDRDALNEKLAGEWVRERRPNEPTALLLVGVDAFDELEQESGPLGGDVALLTIARALGRMLPRKADLLARYDRTTFAVVLPGTDLAGALRVAARLRWSIVRLGIAHPATDSGFVSAGIGVAVQHGVAEAALPAFVAASHGALLKAQLGGADRLEYMVLGQPDEASEAAAGQTEPVRLPSLRAWVAEREATLHSLHN